jgi:hypothetical protein
MSLVPIISLSLGRKCDKITLTESTNVYSINNEGGWGTPNIDTTTITLSEVKVYDYLGTTLLQTFDLTGLYPSATPSEFIILNETSWTQADGIFQIRYEITEDDTIYRNETTHELFLCNLCNCLDKLIARLIKTCDTHKVKDLKTQVDQMEIFIYGIKSAFSCADFETANKILAAASIYCQTLSDCGCGCGGDC